jgi:hypothetical protein
MKRRSSAVVIAIAVAITVAVSVAVAVNLAVAYCHHHPRWPFLSQLLLPITAAISFVLLSVIAVASPLASAIAVSVTVGDCSHHLHRSSPLPSTSPIAESCCLGVARIVFKQFKQKMLTLFYFVWTLGGALPLKN